MATNNWAYQTVNRRQAERRQVTHEENGAIWGPPQLLLRLVGVSEGLRTMARHAEERGGVHVPDALRNYANDIRVALGLADDQILIGGPGWASVTTYQDLDDVQAEHDS